MDSSKNLLIYGNGAMARVLHSFARRQLSVAGFTVDDHCIAKGETSFCGLPLIPFSTVEQAFPVSDHTVIIAVGYTDMNELRERKYQEASAKGYLFSTYIHESLLLHDDVTIEENCIVLDHVSIHPGSHLGRGTFVSSNVNIGHDCHIGHSNWINSGVSFGGGCTVGSRSFFGVNACAGHGVRIGEQNFVGANTLIARDTGDGEVHISESGIKSRLNSKSFLKFSPALNR